MTNNVKDCCIYLRQSTWCKVSSILNSSPEIILINTKKIVK